ncbi:response regulator [Nocardioides perillae]|uniref:Transcriptional regulatory protein n=1 Tax=Nocardioides perillae TaxID=1119534 RepID=A0A7Y9RTH3_9ACTN|nr:response regulator of citrate/malate metabolism [Nocardioides perillae]
MIRVLVVDDDFMVARIHRGFVERTPGFEVVGVAHNAAEALVAVEELAPDLVLLDVYLPDVLGLDLLQQMREVKPDVDVIVISAAREAETVRRALRGGIVHYLIKPFSYDDLRQRLVHYQEAYGQLAVAEAEADQADVDRVFGGASGPTASARLPKGFSAETLRLVEEALRGAGTDLSAAETGEVVGIARVSARRYLEHLVTLGRAEVRLKYGEVGRPERRYAWR